MGECERMGEGTGLHVTRCAHLPRVAVSYTRFVKLIPQSGDVTRGSGMEIERI